jgi:hypothetical protein
LERGLVIELSLGDADKKRFRTGQRRVERAVAEGPPATLDDRPRPGRAPTITLEVRAWLVSLACRNAKDLGYSQELWTTRLRSQHLASMDQRADMHPVTHTGPYKLDRTA